MNAKSKFLGAAAVAAALLLNSARAQDDAPASDAKPSDLPGLLGRTYTSLDLGAFRVRNEPVNPAGFTAGADINLPIDDGFDYRLAFDYDHASKADAKVSATAVNNGVTYYYRTKALTPFVTANLGYGSDRSEFSGTAVHAKGLTFGAGTGVEVPVAKATAVRFAVDFDEAGRKPHSRQFDYGIVANHWFNDTVGASLGTTLRQGRSGAHDAALVTAGVHFAFD